MSEVAVEARIRPAVQAEFESIVELIESSYVPHDPGRRMPGRHPVDLAGAPWTWWGNPALRWFVAGDGKELAAFAMWRMVGRNAHLHSFFVRADCQGRGMGKRLLQFHWAHAGQEKPELQSYTLHVRREAVWARRFYESHGYVEQRQEELDPSEDSGRGDWVRNCRTHGTWPLPEGQLLMVRWSFREVLAKLRLKPTSRGGAGR